MKQTRCKRSAEMLERLLFATSPAVENIDSTSTEATDANTASRIFFSGFSADENSVANTANGAGLGVYPGTLTHHPLFVIGSLY